MKLASVRIQNFRCFGPSAATIDLPGDITALVGANGSGKTALLMALSRMFGVTQKQRTIVRSDFHVPADTPLEDFKDRHLVIDARISFPELAEGEGPVDGIAPTFNQMIVTAPGAAPVCRIRLEAAWADDGTVEGTVEQRQYWVLTDDLEPAEESKQRLSPFDRALIQVLYVPADRDPAQEIRYAAQTGLGRIMRAISWNNETRQAVGSASRTIGDALTAEKGISTVNARLQRRWTELIDEYAASHVSLRFAQANLEQLVRDFGVSFFPGDDGRESDLAGLSDGQQSLFYLALVGAISDIEAMWLRSNSPSPQSSTSRAMEILVHSTTIRPKSLASESNAYAYLHSLSSHLRNRKIISLLTTSRASSTCYVDLRTRAARRSYSQAILPRFCAASNRTRYGISGLTSSHARPS